MHTLIKWLNPGLSLPAVLTVIPLLAVAGKPVPIEICIDYHCDYHQQIQIDPSLQRRTSELFHSVDSAEQERSAISRAIAIMEQAAGEQSETWRDIERNQGDGDEMGQLDCIAESRNTTLYLQYLESSGLLRWHRAGERVRRNPWFFDIHWSATIEERDSGQRYAVDSWPGKNGEPPLIQPIDLWLAGKAADTERP